jgi:hypothetical protein
MLEAFRAEVGGITRLVEAATLASDVRDTVLWCLGQLPALYGQFCQTYESKYAEEILRLEQGVLGKLAETRGSSSVADAVLDRLRLLHECFGLPGLGFKLPPALPPRSRKAG